MDIQAYSEQDNYMKFQWLRPDYVKAIEVSLNLANKYTKRDGPLIVADFCCGTGENTKKFANLIGGLNKAVLIDINKGFLDIAKYSGIKVKELVIKNENILKAKLKKECDVVFSIFAYHHVTDKEKKKYVEQIKSCLKEKGIVILTEIYLKDKNEGINYYNSLLESIPKERHIKGFKEFLEQTAKSTDFEFKVDKVFADKQFEDAGFVKLEEKRIWYPTNNLADKDKGTFVQVYTINK